MITGSVPCIDDAFEDIGVHPEYLTFVQIPLSCNQEAVQYSLEGLTFQRKDLDSNITVLLYN